jgi:hypothetical protein
MVAACLDLGGWASHWSGLWVRDLESRLRAIDVTVLKGRSPGRPVAAMIRGIPLRVHTTTSVPPSDRFVVDGVPTLSVARTLMGMGALVPDELSSSAYVELISRAVDQGLATDRWLWWMLDRRRCRGRDGVTPFAEAMAARTRLGPTESWLERELQRLFQSHGIPQPATQRVIERRGRFAARVDCEFVIAPVVVEALGYAFHRTPAQLDADTRRANEIQLTGREVYQFTTDQIVNRADWVAGVVTDALARHGIDLAA